MNTTLYNHRRMLPPRDQQEDGVYVVADTYRFTTTAATIFDNGAERIRVFMPDEQEEIEAFDEQENTVVRGESSERKAFGIYNSPSHAQSIDLNGKRVGIHSSNGGKAVRMISNRSPILLASTVNYKAVANTIANRYESDDIHLVACGRSSGQETIEDIMAVSLVERVLNGNVGDLDHWRSMLSAARSRYDVSKSQSALKDYELMREFASSDSVPVSPEGKDYFKESD